MEKKETYNEELVHAREIARDIMCQMLGDSFYQHNHGIFDNSEVHYHRLRRIMCTYEELVDSVLKSGKASV